MHDFDAHTVELRGRALVEASAGTGKTHAITTLFLRLLVEAELPLSQILVVTFTEAATAELRERLRKGLRQALLDVEEGRRSDLLPAPADPSRAGRLLEQAIASFDLAAIHTIHGFCHRVLVEHAFATGAPLDVELTGDFRALRDECLTDFMVSTLHDAPVWLLEFAPSTSNRLTEYVDVALRHRDAELEPPPAPIALDELAADVETAFARARESFDAERIRAAIAAWGDGKGHARHHVKRWVQSMERLLEEGPVGLVQTSAQKALQRLSSGGLARHTRPGGRPPEDPFFAAAQDLEDCRTRLEGLRSRLWSNAAAYVREQLPERLARLGRLSFDDLLLRVRDALRDDPALRDTLRARFRAALIDEFQDTDPVQYEIFESLFGDGDLPLVLIGDPKQSIYGFRGADVFAYLRARERTPQRARYSMRTCWRADPGLLRAADAWFDRPDPFVLAGIDYEPMDAAPGREDVWRGDAPERAAPFEVLVVPGRGDDARALERRVCRTVAEEVVAVLDGDARLGQRRVAASDIAVLVRTNQQCEEIERALSRAGVPAVVLTDRSVHHTEEAAELARVLAAVVRPQDPRALRRALATRLLGLGARDLLALEEDDERLAGWLADFQTWERTWREAGIAAMARRVFYDRGCLPRLLTERGGERAATNLLHLVELLHTAERTHRYVPEALLEWFQRQRRGPQTPLPGDAAVLRLESEDEAVRVMTVHKAKGLEFPIVICPFVWKEPSPGGPPVWHDEETGRLHVAAPPVGSRAGRPARERLEWLSESLRLFYVALTRARHRCSVVLCPDTGAFARSAPAALLLADRAGLRAQEDPARALAAACKDADLQTRLEELVERSQGCLSVRVVGEPGGRPRRRAAREGAARPEDLVARTPQGRVDRSFRIASFSSLVQDSPHVPMFEGRDLDDVDASPDFGIETAPVERGEVVPLADFPAGSRAGVLFHEIFERIDFGAVERDDLEPVVADRLRAAGFPAEPWQEIVCAAVREVCLSPLGPAPDRAFRLADVPGERRLVELEFELPLALDPDRPRPTSAMLAHALSRAGSDALPAGYLARLAGLGFPPLCGFLKGFVDLVFEHEGRFWLADYKTTHLGPRSSDYDAERIAQAMGAGHYYLQYHLYTLALHRYLSWRRPGDYDYDRDFGGVLYLFVRGMRRDLPGHGVFFEKPPRDRIEALDELCAGRAGS